MQLGISTGLQAIRVRLTVVGCVAWCAALGFTATSAADAPKPTKEYADMAAKVNEYAVVKLTADLKALSAKERQMIPLLIEAAKQMDGIFWEQAYGDKEALLGAITEPHLRRFVEINYGPWDRLNGNTPFIEGVRPKPAGANFYPQDMTKAEFEKQLEKHPLTADQFKSQYTLIRRHEKGHLMPVPYHEAFAARTQIAVEKMRAAAELAEDAGLERYLSLRANALETDSYRPSDMAWLEMKNNTIDVVIGPIETYEDRLYGYKAAHEAYVLIKDKAWSRRLEKYARLLPGLQRGLPVPDAYKSESPGTDSDLNAYDVVYYAGDCNAGAKTIAINLPNDEVVQLRKGTRRLQLKNAMRAKFDRILEPIADELIAEDQRKHITFDAFFGNTMFHEVAHGLGIKNTINDHGTVREALRDLAGALEEGKADILGLYMVTELFEQGEIAEGVVMDNYVTFLAGIFRSVRFGASSAHGQANMLRFNFFKEKGAFSRDEATGRYRVNFDRMQDAMTELSRRILILQGDGDYEGVKQLMSEKGSIGPQLQADLDRLARKGIPVDIVFEQGMTVLQPGS